jgi:Cof subfamily protein (haloacid dehalogenase superfamily)
MIVTDLDRTLLRTDKTISDYSAGILNKCRQNGIKVVIATGRPKRVTLQFLDKIPADDLIIHNGSVIYADGKQIFHCGIPSDVTKNILHSINRDFPKATLSVEIDDVFYANFEVSTVWNGTTAILTVFSDSDKIFADLPDKPAEKIIIGMDSVNISSGDEIKYFEKYLPDDLYLQMDSGKFIMIMNRLTVKSNAVKSLAERYGYDMSEIIAFGDDFNDVEMIKQCGIGVAVSNAIDEAKAVADYICGSNDEDGVAKWIEENLF